TLYGRLLDHLQNTYLGKCRWLVLDEGGRLMELTFRTDCQRDNTGSGWEEEARVPISGDEQSPRSSPHLHDSPRNM
ncbi:hypothetical protein DFH29DRAFT_960372, partial [Suillus ampliporus]